MPITALRGDITTLDVDAIVADLGCAFAQGYHIGRPMSPDAVTALIEERRVKDAPAPSPLRLVGSN